MPKLAGNKRIIITNILPDVQQESYYIKSALNETVTVAADIFCDGHDEIFAVILLKKPSGKQLEEIPMTLINNDHWQAIILCDETGIYEYQVQAWIDHYTTWKKRILKKIEAETDDINVEWAMGAELIRTSFSKQKSKEREALSEWYERLTEPATRSVEMLSALDREVGSHLSAYRKKEQVVTYPKKYRLYVERKKAAFSTWYELFPRSASGDGNRHGTFRDVQNLLPRIAEMGFDVLYFPPIHPIGITNRKGKNNTLVAGPDDCGSPWAIGSKDGGHKAIHKQLGTLKDFKALVKAAKKSGIEIALDIAFQCSPDHPYVTQHPEWFKWRPDGTVQFAENPPKKYEDILPFDFETDSWESLWLELKSIIDYWIEQGVTIFRVDNPHTKSFYFWEWCIQAIKAEHPDTIFLAEAFTRPRLMEQLAKSGFTQSYTYFTWRNTRQELETYMKELVTKTRYYFRPNFWPNTPDILPPYLTHGYEAAHIIRLVLAATMSSNYGIYGPVYELGLNTPREGKEEYIDNEKYEVKSWDWGKYTRLKEIITRVNKIRNENAALQTTWNISFAESTNEQIICYTKYDSLSGNMLIVAVNLDPFNTQSGFVKIPPQDGAAGITSYNIIDLLSGSRYMWKEEWNYVELNPHVMPAHIFKVGERQTKDYGQ